MFLNILLCNCTGLHSQSRQGLSYDPFLSRPQTIFILLTDYCQFFYIKWLSCLKFSFSFSYILSSETVGVWGYLDFRRWASQILEAYSLWLAFKSDIVFPPSFSFFFFSSFHSQYSRWNLYPTKYRLTYSLLLTVCFYFELVTIIFLCFII